MASFASLQRAALCAAAALCFSTTASSAQNAPPLDGLIRSAAQWAALADANQTDRMWGESGAIMQKSINKAEWTQYLANLRNELGNMQGRDWSQVTRVVNPSGLPAGEYVNVMFTSRFAKATTVEKVSLLQANGKWIPVGYIVSKLPPPAAAAPATGNK